MPGIQDIPIAIPPEWSAEWFRTFVREVLAKADVRNATGSGVAVSSSGNSTAHLDASGDLAAHVAEADPHPQYAMASDLGVYPQKNSTETIEAAWTFLAAHPLITGSTTVGALPAAATAGAGARAFVTDANSSTFNAAAVGGGANIVPVFSTGAAWKVG